MGKKEELKASTMPIAAPWKITERERVWDDCLEWMRNRKGFDFSRLSVRYCVVQFKHNETFWKFYLPYNNTGLQSVLLNEVSSEWVEIFSLKEFKEKLRSNH